MGNNPPTGDPRDPHPDSFQTRFANLSEQGFKEMQAKTREVAEKLNLTKSKSDNSDDHHRRIVAGVSRAGALGVGVPKTGGGLKQGQHAIQGIKIENDPLEREIYVKCPGCSRKVFDSGLVNELDSTSQIYKMREQSMARMEERDDDEDDEYEEYDDEEEDTSSHNSSVEESKKDDKPSIDQKSNKKLKQIRNNSPEERKSPISFLKNKQVSSSNNSNEKLTLDSPTKKRIGCHISPNKQSSAASSLQRRSIVGQSSSDSSSEYVNELEDVVLFCNIETIIADFVDPVSKEAKLQLIQQSLLMPFFQLRTRILEKGSYFKIGGIEFYVAACEPHDFGKVASKTTIRCTQSVSKSDVLQRVNLVPLKRLDNSRTAIFETAIKPFLEENKEFYVHKNQILEFDDYEFYVKYSRPLFGKIDLALTDIKIDSSTPKPVQVLRIAPIWATDRQYEQANAKKNETFDYIRKTYLHPFFFCGFMCYVERGETIKIDDQEFFLNDCRPKYGIVDKQTIIELEVGFTLETFKKKQVLADQRFAERIQTRDTTNNAAGQQVGVRQRAANPMRMDNAEIEEFLRFAAASGSDVMELFDGAGSADQQVPPDYFTRTNPVSHNYRTEEGATDNNQRRTTEEPNQSTSSSATQYNVDEYHMLLMMQQQAQIQQRYLQHQQNMQQRGQPIVTPKAILQALPERTITADNLLRHAEQYPEGQEADDESKKCMVCIMDFETGDSVRTMPCLHFFHTECIDKWLLTRACTCPICKFDIKKNYNAMSSPSLESHSY